MGVRMQSVASCTLVSNVQGDPRLHKMHRLNCGRRLARGPRGTRQASRLFPLPHCSLSFRMGFPGGTSGREATLPIQGMWVRALAWENPLEEDTATHSSVLAWRSLWTEEPGRLRSIGSQSGSRLK